MQSNIIDHINSRYLLCGVLAWCYSWLFYSTGIKMLYNLHVCIITMNCAWTLPCSALAGPTSTNYHIIVYKSLCVKNIMFKVEKVYKDMCMFLYLNIYIKSVCMYTKSIIFKEFKVEKVYIPLFAHLYKWLFVTRTAILIWFCPIVSWTMVEVMVVCLDYQKCDWEKRSYFSGHLQQKILLFGNVFDWK